MKRFPGRLVSAALALALAFASLRRQVSPSRSLSRRRASGSMIGGAVALAAARRWHAGGQLGTELRAGRRLRPGVASTSPPVLPRPSIRRLSMPRPLRSTQPRRNSTRQCSINMSPADNALANASHRLPALGPSARAATTRPPSRNGPRRSQVDSYNRALDSCEQPAAATAQLRGGRNTGGSSAATPARRRPRSPRPPALAHVRVPRRLPAPSKACASSHCCSLNTCKPASRLGAASRPGPGWRCPETANRHT